MRFGGGQSSPLADTKERCTCAVVVFTNAGVASTMNGQIPPLLKYPWRARPTRRTSRCVLRPRVCAFPWLSTSIRLFILVLVGAVIAICWRHTSGTGGWGRPSNKAPTTPIFQADLTPLAAKVPSYVRRVPVQDFQKVKAGDLLIEIVDDDFIAPRLRRPKKRRCRRAASRPSGSKSSCRKHWFQQSRFSDDPGEQADLLRYHLNSPPASSARHTHRRCSPAYRASRRQRKANRGYFRLIGTARSTAPTDQCTGQAS